ncbi:MAG: adenylosuccinate lyase [Planctomycetota bacterium]|jgi:adenylosuccinate lyase
MSQLDYDNPLITRYASREMSQLWGPQKKFSTWRRLWLFLARAERQLGLAISNEQIAELEANLDNIDFDAAAAHERRLRHDVMAHVHTLGDLCPNARPIIHLGATSCYVTDNTDLILIRESLDLVQARLVRVIRDLARFASSHRSQPCLGFTHLQPAQPTTIGKRACLWLFDLVQDLEALHWRRSRLAARGVKGTTGTQASFLKLFNNDHAKVRELDRLVSQAMGFDEAYPVTGQTYSRKIDVEVIDALAGLAQTAHKLATDLRILASRKEVEEPFEKEQIGSSAMAYKRNPMRSERICSLSRYLISLQSSAAHTFANQWLERTLDDSANRRISLPQAFLTADAILLLLQNVVNGLVVYPKVLERHLHEELPFMATENIMMAAVEKGGDRQHLHEKIRQHSQAAGHRVKVEGLDNNLLDLLKADPDFAKVDFDSVLEIGSFVGRAPEQVDEFLREYLEPRLQAIPATGSTTDAEIRV